MRCRINRLLYAQSPQPETPSLLIGLALTLTLTLTRFDCLHMQRERETEGDISRATGAETGEIGPFSLRESLAVYVFDDSTLDQHRSRLR